MQEAHMRMEEFQYRHGDEIKRQMELTRDQIRQAREQFKQQDMQRIRKRWNRYGKKLKGQDRK